MSVLAKLSATGAGAALLCSCATPYLVHDPQSGIIGRNQVTDFTKSVRCELKTFYSANAVNKAAYIREIKRAHASTNPAEADRIREEATRLYPHFMIDENLAGGAYVYLKVVDTLGVGTNDSNLNYRHTVDSTHTFSWGTVPTLNTQNTYDMNYSFAIDQGAGLSAVPAKTDDEFRCYRAPVTDANAWRLAAGDRDAEGTAQFHRIYLNGIEPLAGWLLKNSVDLWSAYAAKSADDLGERIFPLQMNYSFTVQFNIGATVKYNLVAPVWNPAQIGGGLSMAQTSQIQIYFNGSNSSVAIYAKTGTAKLKDIEYEENRARLLAEKRAIDLRIVALTAQQNALARTIDLNRDASAKDIQNKLQSLTETPDPATRQKFEAELARAKSIQSQMDEARARQRAIQSQLARRPRSIYGVEGGYLTYPAVAPAPQTYQP